MRTCKIWGVKTHSASAAHRFINIFFLLGFFLLGSILTFPAQLWVLALYAVAWGVWALAVGRGQNLTAPSIFVAAAMQVVFVMANNSASMLLVCLAGVVLSLGVSARAGHIYFAIPVVTVLIVHVTSGSSWSRVINETIVTGLIMLIGANLAGLAAMEAREQANKRELALVKERERIAGTLHGALGHRLTSVAMSLEFVDRAWGTD